VATLGTPAAIPDERNQVPGHDSMPTALDQPEGGPHDATQAQGEQHDKGHNDLLCTIAVLRVNWAEAARRWAHPPRRPAPWPVRLIAARSAARPERCQQHCQRCDHHAPLGHTHVTLPRLKHVGFLLPPATWSSKVCPGRDPRWRSSTTRARPAWRPCGAAPPPCAC